MKISLFGDKGKFTVFEKGMTKGISEEPSLKMLYIALIILLGVSFKYEMNYNNRLWLILSIFLIFCSEITNTSIEAVVDRISYKYHVLSGYAKDLASSVTILWIFFGFYIFGNWIYNKWIESKIPLDERTDKSINIFDDIQSSLVYIIIIGIMAIPLTYIFQIFFSLSYRISKKI
jgi:diacylglycerol kinase (ATP)